MKKKWCPDGCGKTVYYGVEPNRIFSFTNDTERLGWKCEKCKKTFDKSKL